MRKSDWRERSVRRNKMIYVVVDTNVLVSALWTYNPEAATRRILDLLIGRKITPLYNEEVIAEYCDVLTRPKFPFDRQEVADLIDFIIESGQNADRTPYGEALPDEDDRVFYEISLTREDSFLVTGNLKHFPHSPRVVSPSEFLESNSELIL